MSLNLVDLLILIVLILALVQGIRIGLLTQIFGSLAFFAALFIGGWLFPYIIRFHDPALRMAINTAAVLLFASYAAYRGIGLGQNIHWSFRLGRLQPKHSLKNFEKYFGVLPALIGTLLAVWLIGVGIGRLPFESLSNSVNGSWTIRTLVSIMPPVPSVFDTFNREIDPNDQPGVASQAKTYADFKFSSQDVDSAEAIAKNSLVRITSFGCGGIVSGSGFAASPHIVITNAHVIAGVKRPIIKYGDKSYEGKPTYFNPNMDIAILYVAGLSLKPLDIARDGVPGDTVAVLGFPGGNYKATPGLIRDKLNIQSENIYASGMISRKAYGIQATTEKGSSGGPAVAKNGKVVGMIFSKSTENDNYAYALDGSYLAKAANSVQGPGKRVSTGACTIN